MLAVVSSWDVYIHFPILLVLVNIVYSASRYDNWGEILNHAVRGMVYIVFFLGMVFAVLFGLAWVVQKVF